MEFQETCGQPSQLPLPSQTSTPISRCCSQCQETKTESHFSWRTDRKHRRLTSRCKECRRRNHKENPAKNRQRAKAYYWANRDRAKAGVRHRYRRDLAKRLLYGAKRRAAAAGLPFDLEESDILIPRICPVLGISIQVADDKVSPNSPTIDRINGEKGYVKGNVLVVSQKANTIKSNATKEDLRKVYEFYSQFEF